MSGRHARIDVSLDGIRITRTPSDAARRRAERICELEWDRVEGATLEISRKGRAVVRVAVIDAPEVARHRDDPYAVTVSRKATADAPAVVDLIAREVQVRRQWRGQAPAAATS